MVSGLVSSALRPQYWEILRRKGFPVLACRVMRSTPLVPAAWACFGLGFWTRAYRLPVGSKGINAARLASREFTSSRKRRSFSRLAANRGSVVFVVSRLRLTIHA